MPDDIYENHLKGAYAVESGDSCLIVTARSCFRVQPETVWLVSALPRQGTPQDFGQALVRLGVNEASKVLDRLVAIGVLRRKAGVGMARRLIRALLAPDIRLLPARWQEAALRWAGLHPSEWWLRADRMLLGLPLAALALGVAVFGGDTFATLERMSGGEPSAVVIVLLLLLGGLIHELGHSLAAAACGIGLRPIGFSLYLFFPVFYANVSGMENLPLRRRIAIDGGGLVFQSAFLLALAAVWGLTRDVSVLEAVRWTLLVMAFNLNPLLRTDAYWLYRDLRDSLPPSRAADALHGLYLAAFTAFTLYLFYRVLDGVAPVLSVLAAAVDQPALLLGEGHKVVLAVYLLILVGVGGLARLNESRTELLALRRGHAEAAGQP